MSIGDALSSCPNLVSLRLISNPICRMPEYRLIIASLINTLSTLDDLVVDSMAFEKVSSIMIMEAASAIRLIRDEIEGERRLQLSTLQHEGGCTGSGRGEGAGRGTDRLNNQKTDVDASCRNEILLVKNNYNNYSEYNSGIGIDGHWPGVSQGRGREEGCRDERGISDTGSLLTHGSTVVLAGNMAAAMRQRKRQSVQSQTRTIDKDNRNDNDDENVEGMGSTATGSDCNSRCSTARSRSRSRDRDWGGAEESTLAVLDFALETERRGSRNLSLDDDCSERGAILFSDRTDGKGSGPGSGIGSRAGSGTGSRSGSGTAPGRGGIAFIGEGDITHNDIVRGSAILHKDALENANGRHGRDISNRYLCVDTDIWSNRRNLHRGDGADFYDTEGKDGEGYDYDSRVYTPNLYSHVPGTSDSFGLSLLSPMESCEVPSTSRQGITFDKWEEGRNSRYGDDSISESLSARDRDRDRNRNREREREREVEIERRREVNCNRFSPRQHNQHQSMSASSCTPTSPPLSPYLSSHKLHINAAAATASTAIANAIAIAANRNPEDVCDGRLCGRLIRTPSASFKIAVDDQLYKDLRLRSSAKIGPGGIAGKSNRNRGRGAVFGDLSLSTDREVDKNLNYEKIVKVVKEGEDDKFHHGKHINSEEEMSSCIRSRDREHEDENGDVHEDKGKERRSVMACSEGSYSRSSRRNKNENGNADEGIFTSEMRPFNGVESSDGHSHDISVNGRGRAGGREERGGIKLKNPVDVSIAPHSILDDDLMRRHFPTSSSSSSSSSSSVVSPSPSPLQSFSSVSSPSCRSDSIFSLCGEIGNIQTGTDTGSIRDDGGEGEGEGSSRGRGRDKEDDDHLILIDDDTNSDSDSVSDSDDDDGRRASLHKHQAYTDISHKARFRLMSASGRQRNVPQEGGSGGGVGVGIMDVRKVIGAAFAQQSGPVFGVATGSLGSKSTMSGVKKNGFSQRVTEALSSSTTSSFSTSSTTSSTSSGGTDSSGGTRTGSGTGTMTGSGTGTMIGSGMGTGIGWGHSESRLSKKCHNTSFQPDKLKGHNTISSRVSCT